MTRHLHGPARQSGLSLIELMIAMTIGIFLVGGAMMVFVTTSDARRTNSDIARMQENVRFAFDTMKHDLRLAGMWGKTNVTNVLSGFKGAPDELATITGDCEDHWYIDLQNAVDASDDTNPYSATCLPAAEYAAGTDILVIRRGSTTPAPALVDGGIYIRSDFTRGQVFKGDAPPDPTAFSATAEDHRLETHAYYIRPYTFATGDGIPSLRRIVLTDNGSGTPIIDDEEIVPGVEDLQVQFGVDDNGDGSVNRYLHPSSSALDKNSIKAVRVWIMGRSTRAEQDYNNDATYTYASKSVQPNDAFRRLLASTTIMLRNDDPDIAQ